jgi:hypothetical protein
VRVGARRLLERPRALAHRAQHDVQRQGRHGGSPLFSLTVPRIADSPRHLRGRVAGRDLSRTARRPGPCRPVARRHRPR